VAALVYALANAEKNAADPAGLLDASKECLRDGFVHIHSKKFNCPEALLRPAAPWGFF
jgi:hypothetical protein